MISKWLLLTGAISAEDQELYEYAVYSCMFSLIPLGTVLILSIPLNMVTEGFLFIIPFILLRKFTGGFHFKSAMPCMISSVILLFSFLMGIKFILSSQEFHLSFLAVYLSLIPIIVFSPIDSANRRLSEKEKKIFHRIAVFLGGFFALIFTVLMLIGTPQLAIPVGAGIVLTSLLQLPCLWGMRKSTS